MVNIQGRVLYALLILCSLFIPLKGGNSRARAVVLDAQGNIILAGIADDAINTVTDGAVARLLPDGTLDTSFNPNGLQPGTLMIPVPPIPNANPLLGNTNQLTANAGFNAVALDAQGRIVLAGYTTVGFNTSIVVARINPDGSLDTTFNTNSGFFPGGPGIAVIQISPLSNVAQGIAIDSNQNIVVVGTNDNGINTDIVVLRLTPAGGLDTTFNAAGTLGTTPGIAIIDVRGSNDVGSAVVLDNLNNIYVGGSSSNGIETDFLVAKVLPNGTLDTTFNQFGMFPGIALENLQQGMDNGHAIALDANKNILLAGSSSNGVITNFAILRFTPDGVLDMTFNPAPSGNLANGVVVTPVSGHEDVFFGLAIDNNQNIVATGYANAGTQQSFTTARYTPAGVLDTTFGPTQPIPGIVTLDLVPTTTRGVTNDNSGTAVVVQANNNIVATGFSNFNLVTSFTTPNFLENGSLNSTAFAVDSLVPGIAFTVFQPVQSVIGNGVPTFLGGGISTVAPQIIDALSAPLLPIIPEIIHEGALITREFQPQLTGIASPNALMTLFLGDIPIASTSADRAGGWSVVLPPLLEGSYTVTALATDPITGLSLASVGVPLTITTKAPTIPIIERPSLGDRLTTSRVEFQGRADPHAIVRLFTQDRMLGEAHASPNGIWSLQTERLADGEYAVIAVATDTAEISSLPSDVVTFYIEAEALLRPRILTPERSLVSRQNSIRITGSASANSTIRILVNDKERAKVKVSKEGTWSYTLSKLVPGNYSLVATTLDKKQRSEALNITIEAEQKKAAAQASVPPLAPPSSGLINGVADPFSAITIYVDDRYFGRTVANSKGLWSFSPLRNQRLDPGKHTIAARALDGTGSIVKKEITVTS